MNVVLIDKDMVVHGNLEINKAKRYWTDRKNAIKYRATVVYIIYYYYYFSDISS